MSDTRFSAEPVLDGLMGFQRDTVEHVFDALHSEGGSGRFLVADETGLGKSIVARGLVAKTIERLQDDPAVDRIDVVYICSNMDLARQNIGRLNVTSEEEVAFSSRLTLLGQHSARLNSSVGRSTVNGKLINLISFTPSTSFDPGHQMGQARERALLVLALRQLLDLSDVETTRVTHLLQGAVAKIGTMHALVAQMSREMNGEIDPTVLKQFGKVARSRRSDGPSSLTRFKHLLTEAMRSRHLSKDLRGRVPVVVGMLRGDLARAGISTLQPDLIILDEFQRFRPLLDRDNDAGSLAHDLFSWSDAKVVLLSATPYKPFTYAEEDEDHARDFINTIRFLHNEANENGPQTAAVSQALADYRRQVTTGADAHETAAEASGLLLKVMSRNERPLINERSMLDVHVEPAADLRAEDLAGYVRLKELATLIDPHRSLVGVDYWKSSPYFLTFCNGYRLRERIKDHGTNRSAELRRALTAARHLTRQQIEGLEPVDLGNARLRQLAKDYLDTGVWRLLWLPPSLPYLEPEGVYEGWDTTQLTKRLVFSSWTATPASVASLMSYEVNRLMLDAGTHSAESTRGRLLGYRAPRTPGGQPPSMSTLMLFWPMPGLATLTDPREHARIHGRTTVEDLLDQARPAIQEHFDGQAHAHDPEDDARRVWHAAFAHETTWPTRATHHNMVSAMTPSAKATTIEHQREMQDEDKTSELLRQHIEFAQDLEEGPSLNNEDLRILAEVGAFSPANIAWRVLDRLVLDTDEVTDDGLLLAAAALATGLRTLFNTPHATALVRLAHDSGHGGDSAKKASRSSQRARPFWRQVLEYCASGNLEATLEEWLFNRRNESVRAWTDTSILDFARDEAAAMSLRTSTLTAFDASAHRSTSPTIPFPMRFAVRYGARNAQSGGDDARMPEVRASFNSPFWPFILVSTSVGQEGIDFHWWCHALLHWNIPPNPVDFEQREGRIDRFRGHAIRKNVAHKHGDNALRCRTRSPWEALYDMSTDLRGDYGHFTPDWVYPGPAKIQRHISPFALSNDEALYTKVSRDVALYRLALGQPRQEDMIALLQGQGDDVAPPARISLMAPKRARSEHRRPSRGVSLTKPQPQKRPFPPSTKTSVPTRGRGNVDLSLVTREHVLLAIDEYDQVGQKAFLQTHGFERSQKYQLIHEGRAYASKAIVGVAHKYATGVLPGKSLSGGRFGAAKLLRRLGFEVTCEGPHQEV